VPGAGDRAKRQDYHGGMFSVPGLSGRVLRRQALPAAGAGRQTARGGEVNRPRRRNGEECLKATRGVVATERRRALAFMRGLRARDRRGRFAWWITEHVPGDPDHGMTLLAAHRVPFVEIEPK
jgi:hypothetical protein